MRKVHFGIGEGEYHWFYGAVSLTTEIKFMPLTVFLRGEEL